ncbi:hypothetical protein ACFQV4_33315 [Streptomyces thermocarboxydus]
MAQPVLAFGCALVTGAAASGTCRPRRPAGRGGRPAALPPYRGARLPDRLGHGRGRRSDPAAHGVVVGALRGDGGARHGRRCPAGQGRGAARR